MELTIDERKERYYTLVSKRGDEIYSSWNETRTKSKTIVAKAKEYAFDKRLKNDLLYRFHALSFALALKLRLERRYATFWSILFRLFAFLKERAALRLLKRVLGYSDLIDLREIINAEAESVVVELSRLGDKKTSGGGKRVSLADMTVDTELKDFIEDFTKEEEQKSAEKDFSSKEDEGLDVKDDVSAQKAEVKTDREKISVKEVETAKSEGVEKKKSPQEKKVAVVKEKDLPLSEKELGQKSQAEKPTEKSVASTSILAEKMITEQARNKEIDSPFPVFREQHVDGAKSIERENTPAQKESSTKPQIDIKDVGEKAETVDKRTLEEMERAKSPFPIFRELFNAARQSERPVAPQQLTGLTDEEMARLNFRNSLNDTEIRAIAERLIEASETFLREEERAWREQISVEEGEKIQEIAPANPQNPQNNGGVVNIPKK